jgi:hypothetical protein
MKHRRIVGVTTPDLGRWRIVPARPKLSPTSAAYTDEQLAGRDPHSPEDAADLVIEELTAGSDSNEKVGEEAEQAAREVEAEEENE